MSRLVDQFLDTLSICTDQNSPLSYILSHGEIHHLFMYLDEYRTIHSYTPREITMMREYLLSHIDRYYSCKLSMYM